MTEKVSLINVIWIIILYPLTIHIHFVRMSIKAYQKSYNIKYQVFLTFKVKSKYIDIKR